MALRRAELNLQWAEEAPDGLVFACRIEAPGRNVQIGLGEVRSSLDMPEGFVWVHLNGAAQPAKHWLTSCGLVPEAICDALLDKDERTRLERLGEAVFGVVGDSPVGADPDPWLLAAVRFYLDRRCLITTRRRAVAGPARLVKNLRDGLPMATPAEVLNTMLNYIADDVEARTRELARDTDGVEDEVLAGRVGLARERLGQTRRRAARLRRQVAVRRRAADRFRSRLPTWLSETDRFELLDVLDRFETLADELEAIEQRETGLQAEIAAQLSEDTNRNLFVLSVVTVVLLPMTLITGIFGMNVAGLPGLQDPEAFWWVMWAVVGAGVLCFAALYRWMRF
ncbi:MAG: CorA family divalent cation transporter [Geminicoccaceae bacterium]